MLVSSKIVLNVYLTAGDKLTELRLISRNIFVFSISGTE